MKGPLPGRPLPSPSDDPHVPVLIEAIVRECACLLYTSDAADERSSVDLGGRRIIKKKQLTQDCAVKRIARRLKKRTENSTARRDA